MNFAENKLTDNAIGQELSIGVGPILFPGEINRPQIVTRTSANKLHVAQFSIQFPLQPSAAIVIGAKQNGVDIIHRCIEPAFVGVIGL